MIYQINTRVEYRNILPLRLNLLGIDHVQEPIFRPKGFPFYQWFYCIEGEGELILDQQRSIIKKGQGLLLYPDVAHTYRGLSPNWMVHFFGFSGTLSAEILKSLQMTESGVYHFSDDEMFPTHIQQLYALYATHDSTRDLRYSAACYNFLLNISQNITNQTISSYLVEDDVVQTIILYLEQHYDRPITLDELASQVHLSKDYMCARFKQKVQKSIMTLLLEIRISHARLFLLQFPEKHVQEIGMMCGFENPSYFGKVFRKATGMTPERYRNYK